MNGVLAQFAKQALKRLDEYKASGKLTIELAIKGKTLGFYRRTLGDHYLALKICGWLMDLAGGYNIGKNITSEQAPAIAQAIMKEFYWMTAAELALFFEQAAMGMFGKVYDRLDQAVIFEWLNIHCALRVAAVQAERDKEKENRIQEMANATEILNIFKEKYPDVLPDTPVGGLGFNDPNYRRFYLEYAKKETQQGKYNIQPEK